MTAEERVWMEELIEKRGRLRDVLMENNLDQIWQVITSPYSDQAHFVYELLQNADDAGATEVRFQIFADRLVFTHNGTKRFRITNPSREAENFARAEGKLGDVNAITNVKLSTKEKNDIGKFGIGFKSVFIYTDSPEVYDDGIRFGISEYVIPRILESDYPERVKGTTVFVFPFRTGAHAPTDPAGDIMAKINKLVFPTFFLRNLRLVTWECGRLSGEYRRKVYDSATFDDETVNSTQCDWIELSRSANYGTNYIRRFMLFSRNLPQSTLAYSIGYGLNDDGRIEPVKMPAFCYFPTKCVTNLNYIIQAPFLLTSDRANISEADKTAQEINQGLLSKLADLAASSLVYLRELSESRSVRLLDESILKIVPLVDPDNVGWEHLSWRCFVQKTLDVFQTERVIPYKDGYCTKDNAYVAAQSNLPEEAGGSYSDNDLREIVGNPNAHWVFTGTPIYQGHIAQASKDTVLRPYILKLVNGDMAITPERVLSFVEGDYLESKITDSAWLRKFYGWLNGLSSDLISMSKVRRILLDDEGKATSVTSRQGRKLFLPVEGNVHFRTIHPALYAEESVKELAAKFGLRKPCGLDVIQDVVEQCALAASDKDKSINTNRLLKIAADGSTTVDEFNACIEYLRLPDTGCFETNQDGCFAPARMLWLRTSLMEDLLSCEKNADRFILKRNLYESLCGTKFTDIMARLNITGEPRFVMRNVSPLMISHATKDAELPKGAKTVSCVEPIIPGLESLIARISLEESSSKRKNYSSIVWRVLEAVASSPDIATKGRGALAASFDGIYEYREPYARKTRNITFASSLILTLRTKPWIATCSGSFKCASGLRSSEISVIDNWSTASELVCDLLGIKIVGVGREEVDRVIEGLPDADKQAYNIGRLAQQSGITDPKDIIKAFQLLKSEKCKPSHDNVTVPSPESTVSKGDDIETIVTQVRTKTEEYRKRKQRDATQEPTGRQQNKLSDDDDMQPKAIDFMKKVEELQAAVDAQKEQLRITAELQERAIEASDYTYSWLMSRLELEIRANGVLDESQREASVAFAHIEREPGTENTFILSSPSGDIPQWFEEEVDQTLTLRIPGRQEIRTVIESMSVQSFRLRARVKMLSGMDFLDYSKVVEARTAATKPSFLLHSLRDAYIGLGLSDDFDLKANLPRDIRFIFGPPGTGKTTYLARNELIPMATSNQHPKVLVLTPTNKAADVLTQRVIEEMGADDTYVDWLSRFGRPQDDILAINPVAREKAIRIEDDKSSVVITTIIRFAYDVMMPSRKPLHDIDWDYIVIDEASMIPLMQILYPIYRQRSAKFIIAGDPQQIAPVVVSDLSVGENIYTMVGLTSFADPKTEPYDYEVIRLYTQYRSVPSIGGVFSEFCYGGLLSHARHENEPSTLKVQGLPDLPPLSVFRFPVSRFESIYRVKRLGKSSYQIYSALFTFEYLTKLVEGLRVGGSARFRIGVISPYRAQANIIARLVERLDMPRGVDIRVGTVHGFQGDECELVIALLNPPQGMGRGNSFINDRRVLNVAVSRARDYLLVAIPNAEAHNVEYLTEPLALVNLMRGSDRNALFGEFSMPQLEKLLWGDANYIEKNTYSTGHQDVNVYELPEKRFEVRSEDDALDVQFHRDLKADPSDPCNDSERDRIEEAHRAETITRDNFVVPTGFHCPTKDEEIPLEKAYYLLGDTEPRYHSDENEEIDMTDVVAIED